MRTEASGQIPIDYHAKRDEGIAQALQHAESLNADWGATAYGMLEEFCRARSGCIFTSEDIRRWCELRGFDSPVPKAWGAVVKKAARLKLIVRTGTTIAKQRHGSPCPQWEVAKGPF